MYSAFLSRLYVFFPLRETLPSPSTGQRFIMARAYRHDPSALKRLMFTARFAFGLSSRVVAATITLAYLRDSGIRFSVVIAVTILA